MRTVHGVGGNRAALVAMLGFALVACGDSVNESGDGPARDADASTDTATPSEAGSDGATSPPGPPLSDVIPAERLMDWNQRGVVAPDGQRQIPSFGPCTIVVQPGDSNSLRSAIANCPPRSTISVPEGVYAGDFSVSRSVVIRGLGARTVFTGQWVFGPYGGGDAGSLTARAWTSGLARGSTVIGVADAAGLTVGQTVGLDQVNDPALVNIVGNAGTLTTVSRNGTSFYDGTDRAMLQLAKVVAISGNQVTLDTPVLVDHAASLAPQVFWWGRGNLEYAGIERSKLDGGRVRFMYCTNCWARGVEATRVERNAIEVSWYSYRNEVRDSFIHGSAVDPSGCGPTRYGIELDWTSSTLVENNILDHICTAIAMDYPASGNVVSYNYIASADSAWMFAGIEPHVAHTYANLYEGNVSHSLNADNVWGSGSHDLVFRNKLTGWTASATNQRVALIIEAYHRSTTVAGNILGTRGKTSVYEFDDSRAGNDLGAFSVGFFNSARPETEKYDATTKATLLRWGNYDPVGDRIRYEPAERPDRRAAPRSLPASLLHGARPAWWGGAEWPAFGPDPSRPDRLLEGTIPAQRCFESRGLGTGGVFDASACYPSP